MIGKTSQAALAQVSPPLAGHSVAHRSLRRLPLPWLALGVAQLAGMYRLPIQDVVAASAPTRTLRPCVL